MPQKVKCPSCEAELELPDDPRVDELKTLIQQQATVIQTISARLEKLGETPPAAPTIPKGIEPKDTPKKGRKRYEGAFFDDDQEEDDGKDEG